MNIQISKSTEMGAQYLMTGPMATSVRNQTSANVANTLSSPRKVGLSARNMESSNHKTPNYYSKVGSQLGQFRQQKEQRAGGSSADHYLTQTTHQKNLQGSPTNQRVL